MPARLLEGYFDFHYPPPRRPDAGGRRTDHAGRLGLIDKVLAWRDRLGKLVFGADAHPGAVHPGGHRVRRAAGLLPAVSRHPLRQTCALRRSTARWPHWGLTTENRPRWTRSPD